MYSRLATNVFNNNEKLKIGFDSGGDLGKLKNKMSNINVNMRNGNYCDLKMWRENSNSSFEFASIADVSNSLSNLALLALGKPLNKAYQITDWSHRPLPKKQKEYAAFFNRNTSIHVQYAR